MKSKVKYKLNSPLTRYRWEKWGLEYNTRHFWKKHNKLDIGDYSWKKYDAVYEGSYWTYNVYPAAAPRYAHFNKNTGTISQGVNFFPRFPMFFDHGPFNKGSTTYNRLSSLNLNGFRRADSQPVFGVPYHIQFHIGGTGHLDYVTGYSAELFDGDYLKSVRLTSNPEYVDVDYESTKSWVAIFKPDEISNIHHDNDILGSLQEWGNDTASAPTYDGKKVYSASHLLWAPISNVIVGPAWKLDPRHADQYETYSYLGTRWWYPLTDQYTVRSSDYSYSEYDESEWCELDICYDKNIANVGAAATRESYEYGYPAYDGEYHQNWTMTMDRGLFSEQGGYLYGAKDNPTAGIANTCNFFSFMYRGYNVVGVYTPPEDEYFLHEVPYHSYVTTINGPRPSTKYWKYYLVTPNSYIDGTHLHNVIPLEVYETSHRFYDASTYVANDPVSVPEGILAKFKEFSTSQSSTSTTYSTGIAEYAVQGNGMSHRTEEEHETGFSGDEFWQWVSGPTDYWHKGNIYFGLVVSSDRDAYPDNDHVGDFWYVFNQEHHEIEPGEYVRLVWSTNRNAYPDDGPISDDDPYYYVFDETKEDHNPTHRLEDVFTFSPTEYPNEDPYLGYFYYLAETNTDDEFVITSQFLQNGITYKQNMNNSAQDLQYGAVVSASLEFTIMPQGRDLLSYINKAECEAFISTPSDEGDWRSLGIFKTNKIVQNSNHSLKVTCYDPLYEASQLTVAESDFPNTVTGFRNIITYAIGAMGLDLDPTTIPDDLADLWSPTVAKTDYPTFRDLLAAWAEVMLCSIMVDRSGKVICKRYETRGKSQTVHWERENYATYTPTIDGLQEIRAVRIIDENGRTEMATAGTFVKSSRQDYIIQNNKLAASRSLSVNAAQEMLNILAEYQYYAGTLTAYDDFDIHLGDICTVNQWDLFFVMSLTIAPNGITISGTGNRTYES